jgi:chromosome partitioning protein
MKEIIAITNQKGGVGKTTTAYNLAASLSRYNKRILLIDMDPQGNCSQSLGIDSSISKKTTAELLMGNIDLRHAIRKTDYENIYLIPSNLTLAMVESNLLVSQGKASLTLLKESLEQRESLLYDFIIIDCPPSLGFLSLNAMNAADSVLVPVQCEYFALDALAQLLSSIANVQRSSNPDLSIMGLVLTMYDPRIKLANDISQEVRNNFRDKVFTTTIPRNVSIPEAIASGMPVNQYKPNSAGALAYASLAREVLEYAEKKEKN